MGYILLIIVAFVVTLILSAKFLNNYSYTKYNYKPIRLSNILWMFVPYGFLISGFLISYNNFNIGYILALFAIAIIAYNISRHSSFLISISSVVILFFSSILLVVFIQFLFNS